MTPLHPRLDGGYMQLRAGRWQDVLLDVEVDTLITDPPYSATTHGGHDAGRRGDSSATAEGRTAPITYAPFTRVDVWDFVAHWHPRTRGWFCVLTDHVLAPEWAAALGAVGRYVFAPLPFVEPGSRVRLRGDGPSSWTCWLVVARPTTATFAGWGTLRGAYVATGKAEKVMMGGKPLPLMRQVVQDYSRPGDLVCVPCAGGGTTLLAAALERRNAVGAEQSPVAYETAVKRLAQPWRGYTPPADVGGDWLAAWRPGGAAGG
jgi:site-specific DNA-methyltransferase (adenine-specific)